ncbi:MAG: hypothetical protein JSW26_05240 [Desulfobacterales bacterium]|nr:MAG: hypothetical protein JSW26_05240 [Desulfobacterales bacterium]
MTVFKTNTQHAFAPGFRLSVVDMTILTVGLTATFALATVVWWLGFVFGFVLGHFFLFCNVVRMSRPLELAWAAVFVVLAAATVALGTPGWQVTVSVSLFTTVVVVFVQILKPSYHGFGWQWINPELPNWWESRVSKKAGG